MAEPILLSAHWVIGYRDRRHCLERASMRPSFRNAASFRASVFPMKAICDALGVARSNVAERWKGRTSATFQEVAERPGRLTGVIK